VERLNNKVRVIQQHAYGLRNVMLPMEFARVARVKLSTKSDPPHSQNRKVSGSNPIPLNFFGSWGECSPGC